MSETRPHIVRKSLIYKIRITNFCIVIAILAASALLALFWSLISQDGMDSQKSITFSLFVMLFFQLGPIVLFWVARRVKNRNKRQLNSLLKKHKKFENLTLQETLIALGLALKPIAKLFILIFLFFGWIVLNAYVQLPKWLETTGAVLFVQLLVFMTIKQAKK